jgi:DNA-binding NarL/FixJ family response regulator
MVTFRSASESPLAEIPLISLADASAALAARPYARRGAPALDATIRVVLVDDHLLVRSGIRSLLRTAPDIAVVGEAANGREAVALALRVQPDVVVMDLNMVGGDGATATRRLAELAPDTRVLVLSMHGEEEQLLPLLRCGARGYLTKTAADRELADAIRVVAAGDVYVRPAVARQLAASAAREAGPVDPIRAHHDRLSPRERTVLQLVAHGHTGPEIGERLGITAKSVDTYRQRIQEKLGLSRRSDYVRFAIDAGLLG